MNEIYEELMEEEIRKIEHHTVDRINNFNLRIKFIIGMFF